MPKKDPAKIAKQVADFRDALRSLNIEDSLADELTKMYLSRILAA